MGSVETELEKEEARGKQTRQKVIAIVQDTRDESLYKGKRRGEWRRDMFELEKKFLTVCVWVGVSKLF